jgi:hypothetical protein
VIALAIAVGASVVQESDRVGHAWAGRKNA